MRSAQAPGPWRPPFWRRKNQVQPKLKEVKLRPAIDDNDLNTKLKHAREFLLHGDKVRVLLQFRGREMSHQDLGMQIMTRFIKELDDVAKQDSPAPSWTPRTGIFRSP